jgi:hypothetical protein
MGPTGTQGNTGATGSTGATGATGLAGTADSIPNLIAYYRGSGVDLSGNGNDATVNGTVPLVADRFGNPAVAASLDGTATNFLSVAVGAIPVGTAPRTVSLWFRTSFNYSNRGSAGSLFNWGTSATQGARFGFVVTQLGNYDYFVGEFADHSGTASVCDGIWHHVVISYDGAAVTEWLDAEYQYSAVLTLNTIGTTLRIGASSVDHGSAEPFVGEIDDLRIFSRVLSRDERGLLFLEGGWLGVQ